MSQNALVTGAARGIGRAIAFRLARDGFNVAVNDVAENSSPLNKVQAEIRSLGRKSIAVIGDVSVDTEVEQLMGKSAKELGSLNVSLLVLKDVSILNHSIGCCCQCRYHPY